MDDQPLRKITDHEASGDLKDTTVLGYTTWAPYEWLASIYRVKCSKFLRGPPPVTRVTGLHLPRLEPAIGRDFPVVLKTEDSETRQDVFPIFCREKKTSKKQFQNC